MVMEMLIEPKCPRCGRIMAKVSGGHNSWPYVHVDHVYTCCGAQYAFGVPADRTAGLALWIWHTDPLKGVKEALELGERVCPFCDLSMRVTKIVEGPGGIAVQWKCPKCYYAAHYPTGAGVSGSVHSNPIVERLMVLGYFK